MEAVGSVIVGSTKIDIHAFTACPAREIEATFVCCLDPGCWAID